jgi:CHAT domain-containing protein
MPDLPAQPGQNRQQLAPLPGAEIEANLIAEILETKPLIGAAADKLTVIDRMEKARIMHFATHGLLDYGEGLMSSLALAPVDGDTGFLRANEIMALNLHGELAVLSACDTGLGRITGDGMVGLSRSFITAGIPSLVVSLWKIPDEPTAILMTEFYRQLAQGQSTAIALRSAMLTTREQYPQARNWAAFTLMGLDR